MSKQCERAIKSVKTSTMAFCKFLSANDSGETGGHQVGILVSKKAYSMMFSGDIPLNGIKKRAVKISWPDGTVTTSNFTYYSSKKELRITSFGRGFSFLKPWQTGSLFIMTMQDIEDYTCFFLDTEDEMDEFLEVMGINATETNDLIQYNSNTNAAREFEIRDVAASLLQQYPDFPTTFQMSQAARDIWQQVNRRLSFITENPDKQLVGWTDVEFKLFRAVENEKYRDFLHHGFNCVDDFVVVANSVLNRRKSRAGKSLEHQLEALFDGNHLLYTAQAKTELRKTPDFIFPSEEQYHNMSFPSDKLISLAAKTTCKDRWRQVITEAARIPIHHLCTLQQGISSEQLKEMESENVVLVVPNQYISSYPAASRNKIWTVKKFIAYVKEKEGIQ